MSKSKVIAFIVLCVAIISLVLLVVYAPASAADKVAQVKLTWDGKDTSGATELSLPVTITVYNADTSAVLSTANVPGPVTNFNMPTFTVTVPDNGSTVLKVNAKAKDSVGNTSAASATVVTTLYGADTVPPGVPVITITIQ